MFSTVQAVNTRLKVIGNALYPVKHMPLTWDANYDNFTSTNGLSATTLVDAVWPNGRPSSTAAGRLEFGQFHNGEADYVLAVNRLTKTGQTVDLRFDVAQMASVDVGGGSFQVEDVSVGDGTPSTLMADANGHIPVTGQTLAAGEARLYRIEWLPTLRAQWVVDGTHVFAHEKARLTWDDPGNTAITGWEYRQQEGDSAWGPWQKASSSATTVTKDVEGLKIWGTYRFKVRARYGPGADDTGPESGEAVLSPWLEFTQAPTVVPLGGDGKAQLEVGFDWPVDRPAPEGSLRILPENVQVQVVTVTATGEKTESDYVALSSIGEVLPGAALAEAPLEDLPPVEEPASGEAGASASSASSRAISSFGVSGLKNGVTYQFKVRLVRPDGVTGSASAPGSLLGLRQRRTGAVALSWTDPRSPAITAWQYRQQAGSESWGLWQRMSGSTRSTTSHTVSGLGAAETYRFQVRGIGPGGPFAESFTVSAPAVPSPPRNFKAVAGDGQVLLTWQAPASTGGSSLLGYHYRESGGGRTTGWIEFQKTWTRYLPQNLRNGQAYTFEVRAYNREGSSASVDTTVTPAGAPRAPGGFTAVPGDGQVALSWTAADSNGAPITAYEVQYAPKSDPGVEVDWSNVTWSEVPGDSTARDTTITGLSHGTPYGFRVAARNRVNLGTPAEKEATPLGNRPPVITAPDTVWFAEHRTDSVATLSASDPEGQAVTWSHTGADVGLFKVQGDTLSFKMTPDFPSPDFEAPRDVDEDNFYEVTLTATDDGEPAASASHDMTVAVTNAPEAGTVTLSTTQPRVGMHLTATLTDPDQGVTNDRWSWEELGGASSAGQRTQPPAQSQRYTVEDRVKGRRLVAKVAYTDGHGPDQAVSDTTAAVRANVPGAPGGLQAEPGDGRVTLRWTAADSNGAWITGYAYRDSAHTAGSTWSAWPETALIAGDATSHPVTGLDNGTGYTFEVRAVNPVGAGPASSPASATPRRADTAGAIDLSHSTPPKVNQQMTATLRDPDDPQLATAIWRWDRVGASSSTDEGATGAVDQGNTYTPGSGDVGYQIRVTVTYTDNYGSHTVRKTTEDAVTATECVITVSEVSKTDVPENSTPTVGVYEATANSLCGTLTWSRTGSDAGSFVLRAVTGQPNQRSLHFVSAPDYEAKRIYSVTIRVADPSGRAGTFPRTVRVTDVNEPPVITGPANKSVPENTPTTATVATYSATDPEDDSVSWDLSGTDEDDFQISSGGALRFGSTPNYEAAADANTDNSYKVTVVATDDGSPAASSSKPVTVTVTDVNEPPSLTGLTTVTRDENGTSPWTVTPYSASDPDNNTLHFTHRGDQASYFQLTGSGSSRTLEFKSQPNYETRQTYKVRVVVRDRSTGGLKDSVTTTVTLNDIDDPGRVVITNTAPRVGQQITAKLYDEDGDVANDLWFWVALASGASGTQSQRPDATSHAYTIKAKDVGKVLEATVEYDDGDGPGKTAHTTSNTVSASAPGAPKSFTASRGDGEVYLSWGEAEDNGSDIIHYETRSKAQTASSWSGWSEATKGADARADTFSSLTNGTAYSFEVRAENDQGEGPAASDAATPATLPGAPPNLATDRQGGNGFMELTWGAAPANGSPVLHYYYRYKKTGDDDWRGWYRRAGGANARSKSWSNFDDGSAYVFQVRARNAVGYGTTAQISASALGPGGSTDDEGAGGHEETEDELMPEGEVPEPGEDEVVVVAKPVAEGPAGWLAAADSLAVRSAPNPFNPSTTLHFQLPETGPVTLTVYNVAGQVVAELVRGEILDAGLHAREWHGTDDSGRLLGSGLYLYRLNAGGQVRLGKLALIR